MPSTHPFDPQWKFVQAKNFQWVNPQKPRHVNLTVMHTMENPDRPTDAEGVANWFASPTSPEASAHACVDQNSIVLCVEPKDIAWACGGGNWPSYNIEQGGYAKWDRTTWLIEPNPSMLRLAAAHVAKAADWFGIPLTILGEDDVGECLRDSCIRQGKIAGGLALNRGGITTHVTVNAAWKNWQHHGLPEPKGDLSHTDCGPGYPIDQLLAFASPTIPPPARVA